MTAGLLLTPFSATAGCKRKETCNEFIRRKMLEGSADPPCPLPDEPFGKVFVLDSMGSYTRPATEAENKIAVKFTSTLISSGRNRNEDEFYNAALGVPYEPGVGPDYHAYPNCRLPDEPVCGERELVLIRQMHDEFERKHGKLTSLCSTSSSAPDPYPELWLDSKVSKAPRKLTAHWSKD